MPLLAERQLLQPLQPNSERKILSWLAFQEHVLRELIKLRFSSSISVARLPALENAFHVLS